MNYQDIVTVIAALAVEADGLVVPVYAPNAFKRAVESADCPARIILPSTEGEEHTWEQISKGSARAVWVVKELLLYKPVEEGAGWYEVGYSQNGFVCSYMEKLAAANQNTTTGFCGLSANVVPPTSWMVGTFTYPINGTRRYYGVMTTLHIMQFV